MDHFGVPDPKDPLNDPGFKYLLSKGKSGKIWVKVSATYRIGGLDNGNTFAKKAIPLLLESYGPKRLLWGSDWPHTGNEKNITYDISLQSFESYVPDKKIRNIILTKAPQELFAKSAKKTKK